jgi:short subunit dehydrogenase-like uncharacterized protein
MREMIDKHQAAAGEWRAHEPCGFDSVPFELGAPTQEEAKRVFDTPACASGRVRGTCPMAPPQRQATFGAVARISALLRPQDPFA